MDQNGRCYAACGGAIFFLVSGAYLVDGARHVTMGEAFMIVGGVLLPLALYLAIKPTER